MAILYSVPLLAVRDHSARPNPTEKRSTFTPHARATTKCPNSWKVTSSPRVTISHQKEPAMSERWGMCVWREKETGRTGEGRAAAFQRPERKRPGEAASAPLSPSCKRLLFTLYGSYVAQPNAPLNRAPAVLP